jgi:predicted O-linked N-acetylglucosamine transferase (SPINDLY family)
MTEAGTGRLLQEAWGLHRSGLHEKAIVLYRAILSEQPRNFDALYFLGLLHGQNGRFDEAQAFTGEALLVNPMSADALFLRSYALGQLGRDDEAIICLDRVIALNPDLPEALLNRASVLFRLRRYEAAVADYERLLTLNPEYPFARGNLLFSRLQICDWRDLVRERAAVAAQLQSGKRIIAPFQAKMLDLSPEAELACARIWVGDQYPPRPPLWQGERYTHERIRIAYVSADFHAHAMANLAAGLFEHHDRSRFETMAISFGPDDRSDMRARLIRGFNHFADVRGQSEADIARLIRDREVDIAVDLMGFTEGCRPAIFAARPAPVQVSFLGFPGTLGAPWMDYLIADASVVPADQQAHYAENIVTLPDAFMPADSAHDANAHAMTRAGEGLPETGFVFCSFNAGYKITPAMFAIWMRLLARTEGSVLWIGQANAPAQRNLQREAEARGVDSGRLVFAPYRQARADHLARLALADLFLDTVPYNAHATAIDALGMGLPVLTCQGKAFAGRVGASLLHALGVPELIAASLEEYETLALNLAREPAALLALKARLSRNRTISPLFDIDRFTRHLEAAYVAIWERQHRGLPPAAFAVSA